MKPLISLVLPVYNIKEYLPRCVASVVAQTYDKLEIILVDDGSTDGSGKLCDELSEKDKRIRVYHKPNGGLSDARNYGIARAAGEYISPIDPDDEVDEDYVEYLYSLIEKYGTLMATCEHRVIKSKGRIVEQGHPGDELMDAKTAIEEMLYHGKMDTCAWAKLYHYSLFINIQYPYGKYFEDLGTTYKLFLASGKVAVGFESKYSYILRSSSITFCEFNPKKMDHMEMTDAMARDVQRIYPDLEPGVLRCRVYSRISTLNQMSGVKGLDMEKKELISFIKKNADSVLENPKTPKRDRIALKLLKLNYKIYDLAWKIVRNK